VWGTVRFVVVMVMSDADPFGNDNQKGKNNRNG
jgi:hypothetical protein